MLKVTDYLKALGLETKCDVDVEDNDIYVAFSDTQSLDEAKTIIQKLAANLPADQAYCLSNWAYDIDEDSVDLSNWHIETIKAFAQRRGIEIPDSEEKLLSDDFIKTVANAKDDWSDTSSAKDIWIGFTIFDNVAAED